MELISTKTRFDTAEDAVDSILNEKVAIALGHKFIHVYPTGANITEVNGKQTNFQPTLDKATAFDLMIAQGLRISVGYVKFRLPTSPSNVHSHQTDRIRSPKRAV
jgi:hypothetical protein